MALLKDVHDVYEVMNLSDERLKRNSNDKSAKLKTVNCY